MIDSQLVQRYYALKQQQKEMERELAILREHILAFYGALDVGIVEEVDGYRLKVTLQQRKDYDDLKVYEALPEAGLWRLLSKVDPAKVTSLLKLNILSEHQLAQTFAVRTIPLVQVEKI
ncbi:hypothetical protein J2Z69_000098 [Paenibacillus shirakamiensis]|uniref:Uncharacterized protein n=1 Tax=Paenibacillus shirakamiensis TaxID=1265935 RepID=A0ABS4JER7_9BACL|nr:hypothetical protein [Paenibacillus shirakamiensis]MBP1999079.1 hypothetical protein [Paenibacillus shirakamiensis]